MPPLLAVNRPQVAVLVGPFVPDGHLIFLQVTNVSLTAKEPQQFVDDRAQMQLLRREQREIILQGKARLRAEDGIRAGTRAVGLELSVLQNVSQQLKILDHAGENLTTKHTEHTKENHPLQAPNFRACF